MATVATVTTVTTVTTTVTTTAFGATMKVGWARAVCGGIAAVTGFDRLFWSSRRGLVGLTLLLFGAVSGVGGNEVCILAEGVKFG